ncbi:MAG: hypothetical protein ACLRTQ_11670 [Candidatus Borkfalkia sp.]
MDRAGAVDDTGAEINRNRLIALVSAYCIIERAGGTIVTDSVTSEHRPNSSKAWRAAPPLQTRI